MYANGSTKEIIYGYNVLSEQTQHQWPITREDAAYRMSSPAATLPNVTCTPRSRRLYQRPRLCCLLLELLNAPFPISLQLCVLQLHLPPDVLLERHLHLLFREAR